MSEIQKFMVSQLFLQLQYILLIHSPLNCVYVNYIVLIMYIRLKIDKI